MAIIMDLAESVVVIDPSINKECMNKWRYYMKNVRWSNGMIDYKLLEIGIFGRYESSYNSSSHIDPFSPILS